MAVEPGQPELAQPERLPGQAPHSVRPEPEALQERPLSALTLGRALAPGPRVEQRLAGLEQTVPPARRAPDAA